MFKPKPAATIADSTRNMISDEETGRLKTQFLIVGCLSGCLFICTELLSALSVNAPETRTFLFELTTIMTLLAGFILAVQLCRLVRKALWIARDARDNAECLTRRSELILNSAAEAIWVVDQEGRTTFLNPAAEKVTGWMFQDVTGECQHVALRHSNACGTPFEIASCPICKAFQEGKSHYAAEDVFWKKDGTSFPVEYHLTPLHESGRVVGSVLTFKNISERRLLQSQLVQAQKLESIGQLAAGIAHEINTPIQFIGDNTRFLKDAFVDLRKLIKTYEEVLETARCGQVGSEVAAKLQGVAESADLAYLSEEVPKAIDQSLDGITRVTKIVRAMKDFSHPDGDTKAPADLNKAIESTVTVARNEWKYVADLVLNLDPELPNVACLVGELNQVILNLLVNAAHAIGDVYNKTSQKGTITILTKAEGEHAVIRVSDTGGGIPVHIRDKIFDPFFTTKPVGKGTGQGLAIAYSVIVEKHGGTIGFETQLGKGTTFIIRLPINPSTKQEAERHQLETCAT